MDCSTFTIGVLQYFMLGKPMRWFEVVSMFACYIGIVLIVYDTPDSHTHNSYPYYVGLIATITS